MWNRSGEGRHPCFVPALSGKASNLSPLSLMPIVGLSLMPLFGLRKFPSIPSLGSPLILFDASFPSPGSFLTCWILKDDPLQISRFSLCETLSSLVLCLMSMNSGSLGLSRPSAPSFQLRDNYTLVPPPCVETQGSGLGQSEGSSCYFPFSHGSLSFFTWCPMSLKLLLHIFVYFIFLGGGLLF